MALLSLNGVSITFAGPALLDSVSLQIDDGERLGLDRPQRRGQVDAAQDPRGHTRSRLGQRGPPAGAARREPPAGGSSRSRGLGAAATCTRPAARRTSDQSWEIETRIDQIAHDLTLDLDAAIESLSAGSKRRVLLAAALVQRSGSVDPGRAHQPPRHRRDPPPRGRAAAPARHARVRHPRPQLPAHARHPHPRPGPRHRPQLPLHLRRLRRAARGRAARRGRAGPAVRQEAGAGRSVGASRHQGAPHAATRAACAHSRRCVWSAAPAATRSRASRRQLQEADRSGRMVLRCQDVRYGYDGAPIVRDLTTTILRGDRIGIMGSNGCGKTTLIRLLLGDIAPQQGTVTAGTKLEVAHFEQLHDVLDDTKSVIENVADGARHDRRRRRRASRRRLPARLPVHARADAGRA